MLDADLGAQTGGQLTCSDALLPHRIPVADGDRLVLQALEVDGDAEGRPHLVLPAVELADGTGVVVDGCGFGTPDAGVAG